MNRDTKEILTALVAWGFWFLALALGTIGVIVAFNNTGIWM